MINEVYESDKSISLSISKIKTIKKTDSNLCGICYARNKQIFDHLWCPLICWNTIWIKLWLKNRYKLVQLILSISMSLLIFVDMMLNRISLVMILMLLMGMWMLIRRWKIRSRQCRRKGRRIHNRSMYGKIVGVICRDRHIYWHPWRYYQARVLR